jgi:hypothetical protein
VRGKRRGRRGAARLLRREEEKGEVANLEGGRAEEVGEVARQIWMTRRRRRRRPDERGGGGGRREGGEGFRVAGAGGGGAPFI